MSALQGLLGLNLKTGVITMERELGLEIGWLVEDGPPTIGVPEAFGRILEKDRARLQAAFLAARASRTPLRLVYDVRDRNGHVRAVSFEGLWSGDPEDETEAVFGSVCEIERFDPDLEEPTAADRVMEPVAPFPVRRLCFAGNGAAGSVPPRRDGR